MDTVKKKIGNKVRRLRQAKGLKQSELAELVGVEDKTISRIEVGGNYPSLDLLVRMSTALECDLTEFVNINDRIVDSLNEISMSDIEIVKKFVSVIEKKIKQLKNTLK